MKTAFKNYREFALNAIAWTLFALSAMFCDACQTDSSTHDGKVVSFAGSKLVMTSEDGKEHSHALATDAKLTLDGMAAQPADLKAGTRIRVTTKGQDGTATRVEAIQKNLVFATHIHDGTLVGMKGEQLVLKNALGSEKSLKMPSAATCTLDGKTCQNSDLKQGAKIRVFTQDPYSLSVARIEAIDRNPEFAPDRHDGKLVKLSGDKLSFESPDGKEHDVALPTVAVLRLDGRACKAADLKPGTRIRVTTRDAYSPVATTVDAIDRRPQFDTKVHDGLVVSVAGNQLLMTDLWVNNAHTCTLSADVKITIDGKAANLSELRPGLKIRVTKENDNSRAVTQIEAIDKNSSFTKSP